MRAKISNPDLEVNEALIINVGKLDIARHLFVLLPQIAAQVVLDHLFFVLESDLGLVARGFEIAAAHLDKAVCRHFHIVRNAQVVQKRNILEKFHLVDDESFAFVGIVRFDVKHGADERLLIVDFVLDAQFVTLHVQTRFQFVTARRFRRQFRPLSEISIKDSEC